MTKKKNPTPKKKTAKLTLSVSALRPLRPSQLQQVSGAGYGRHYGWSTPGR